MPQFVEVGCPHCNAVLKLRDPSTLGKTAPCPKCGEPFMLKELPTTVEAFTDEEVAGRGDVDDLAEFDDVSPGRRKSGWVVPTLIAVGSLAVLMVIGGIYLATTFFDTDSDTDDIHKTLAYLPHDAEFIGVIRVSEVIDEPSMKGLRRELTQRVFTDKMFNETGLESIEDIEIVAFGIKELRAQSAKATEGGVNGIVVIRAKKPFVRTKVQKGHDVRTHNGKTYYLSRHSARSGERSAVYLPDRRTAVFGPQSGVKEIIEQGARETGRTDLDFVDFRQPLLVVCVPKDQRFLANPLALRGSRWFPGIVAVADRNIRGIAVGLSFQSGPNLKVQAACAELRDAEAVERILEKQKAGSVKLLKRFGRGSPEREEQFQKAADSLRISSSGTTVEITMNLPQTLIDEYLSGPRRVGVGRQTGRTGFSRFNR